MVSGDLFRREAVEHRQQKLYGEVLLHVPASRWPVTVLVVLVFVLLVGFLCFGRYARKESVSGWLRPDGGLIRLESPSEGVVEAVHGREGDVLAAGAEVATLRLGGQADAKQSLFTQLQAELAREREQLARQTQALQARFDARKQKLSDEVQAMEAELAQYQRQLQTLEQRAELALRQQREQADLVQQGFVTRRDADKLEDARLTVLSTRESVRQDMLARATALRSARQELAGLGHERDLALAELGEKRAALEQRGAEAARRGRVVLTAPVAARLASLRLEPGAAVRAGTLVADLVPEQGGGRLQAELFAPSRALGVLKPGDEVQLRLDAYPYQAFGTARGHVQAIARSAVDASELPLRQAVQGPVYRVLVSVDALPPLAGQAVELRAGMTLQGDVLLERRRIVEYLFAPLLELGGR